MEKTNRAIIYTGKRQGIETYQLAIGGSNANLISFDYDGKSRIFPLDEIGSEFAREIRRVPYHLDVCFRNGRIITRDGPMFLSTETEKVSLEKVLILQSRVVSELSNFEEEGFVNVPIGRN